MQDEQYAPKGSALVMSIGDVELKDGRIFHRAAILTFPNGTPKLPITVIWDQVPMRLEIWADRKDEKQE